MKHIQSIYEWRNQLEIPFDNKHPLHDKPVHQHILDVLHTLDTKKNPTSYKSTASIGQLWKMNYTSALDMYRDDPTGNWDYPYPQDLSEGFLDTFPKKKYPSYYLGDFDFEDFVTDPTEYLSAKGLKKIDKLLVDYFNDRIDDYIGKEGRCLETDENGLIPIYRAITYHKINKDWALTPTSNSEMDEYENAIQHRGVGKYWSWVEEGAVAHGGGRGETFVLYGKVKPEFVDWQSTIYKNAWGLNEEKEIELKEGITVLIYKIRKWRPDNIFINIEPILVPA